MLGWQSDVGANRESPSLPADVSDFTDENLYRRPKIDWVLTMPPSTGPRPLGPKPHERGVTSNEFAVLSAVAPHLPLGRPPSEVGVGSVGHDPEAHWAPESHSVPSGLWATQVFAPVGVVALSQKAPFAHWKVTEHGWPAAGKPAHFWDAKSQKRPARGSHWPAGALPQSSPTLA